MTTAGLTLDLLLFQIRKQQESADVDDIIENYDYENVNDRENFCPNDDVSFYDYSRELKTVDTTITLILMHLLL